MSPISTLPTLSELLICSLIRGQPDKIIFPSLFALAWPRDYILANGLCVHLREASSDAVECPFPVSGLSVDMMVGIEAAIRTLGWKLIRIAEYNIKGT